MKLTDSKAGLVANIHYFIKWMFVSAVIGSIGGLAGSVFSYGVAWATGVRTANSWLLFLMPVAGLLIVWMYRTFHEEGNRGTNMVLESISSDETVSVATGPLIFLSTILTHLVGGSSGREGAALQLGGSIGNAVGGILKLDERDKKVAIMCGMSAVFAALFGTPVAAGIFSMEVVSIGVLYYAALVPCIFSSYLGVGIARHMGLPGESFPVENVPGISLGSLAPVVLLGILCAGLSILFCELLHTAEHTYKKYLPNPYMRILTASAIFIALTLLIGTRDYCGGSMVLIEESVEGHVRYEAFFLKMLFTAIALGAGFKGGEIVPTLCVGATFGCTVGSILGFSPSLCAACGMAAMFAGVTNCPISSLIIALELFGYEGMEYYSIVIAVSFALSGYYGLYSSQKFVYSKIRTEFINRKSN
ncbi:MAG: chloride channel protein [Enterocloster sp.]